MEISKNEKTKTISIWINNQERQDAFCQTQIKALIKTWYDNGWLPVMYYSGTGDLYANTSALLKHNRDNMARQTAVCNARNASPLARIKAYKPARVLAGRKQ